MAARATGSTAPPPESGEGRSSPPTQGLERRHNDEPTFWHRSQQTPLTVIFTDTAERVEALLTLIDELLPDAVAVAKQVRSARYPRPLTA